MTEPDQPTPAGEPQWSVEHLDSHDGVLPGDPFASDVVPTVDAPHAPTRHRRTAVIATLAVLGLLVVGGGVAAALVLHRPDVTVSRALDATKAAPQGDITLSLSADAAALATGPASLSQTLATSSVRYAWAPGTQQFGLTYEGAQLGTVTVTDTHLTVQADFAKVAQISGSAGLIDQLTSAADSLGPDGDVLRALAEGRPVGLDIGPDSDLRSLLNVLASASGSAVSPKSISSGSVADALTAILDSVKSNSSGTSVGSDANGEHYVDVVTLRPVAQTAVDQGGKTAGSLGSTPPDLSKLDGVTVPVDIWVRDGQLSRIEIPLGALMKTLDPSSTQQGEIRVMAVIGTTGVVAPAGTVTEVPGSLLSKFTMLGGLGQ